MKFDKIPAFGALVPTNVTMTVDRAENGAPIRYCVDAVTEGKMQNLRLLGTLSGPVIVWAGWKYNGGFLMRLAIMAMGAGMTISNYAAYTTVKKAEKDS
jgi:hypothetical protein